MLLDPEEAENRDWIEGAVKRQSRYGADFASRDGIYRRTDGLANAYWSGLISRVQMQAGRQYERDYDELHRSGKYRSTIWRFIGEDGPGETESDRTMAAALRLRLARAVLTPRQRIICDEVCGEDVMLLDGELADALDRLFEHYGADYGGPEHWRYVYRPPILSPEERRAQRIKEALARLAKPMAPTVSKPRGPGFKPAMEETEAPELEWSDFLPQKPTRTDATIPQAALAAAGVLKSNRDMRHLGVQAKAANKVKARATGHVRKKVRRKGNS